MLALRDFPRGSFKNPHGRAAPDALLHDDFEQGVNKDVYVENTGAADLIVRVQFAEYLQIGNEAVIGGNKKNKDGWRVRLWYDAPDYTPDDPADAGYGLVLSDDNLHTWYMTGENKVFKPGTGEMGNNTYTIGQVFPDGTEARNTLPPSRIITMTEYITNIVTYAGETQGRWILDDSPDGNGWCYWSQRLSKGQATNLLLDNVEIDPDMIPDDNYIYIIDVRLQAANEAEARLIGKEGDISENAQTLIDLLTGEITIEQIIAAAETQTFIDNIASLAALANNYTPSGGEAVNEDFYDPSWRKWLPFRFISAFKYNNSSWAETSGPEDTGFKNYVMAEDPGLYQYFRTLDTIPGDAYGTTRIDVKHMTATLTAIQFKTTTRTPVLGFAMTENQYNELAGWAGDLQQMIYQDIWPTMKTGSYDQYYDKASSLIGSDTGAFGMDDLLADVDAVNIFNALKSKSVGQAISDYYTSGYETRFSDFFGAETLAGFKARANVYSKTTYRTPIGLTTVWPLYSQNGITASAPLPVSLETGVANAVADYIWSLRE